MCVAQSCNAMKTVQQHPRQQTDAAIDHRKIFMSIQFGPDYVRAIAPYQGGKPIAEVAREFGLDESKIVKLATN
jgi:hypothetical protein